MLNEKETQLVLQQFFMECLEFWKRSFSDERRAFEYAIDDVRGVEKDPYSPRGKELDPDVKERFIKYRELDLGKMMD
jgi:hypothetical protein